MEDIMKNINSQSTYDMFLSIYYTFPGFFLVALLFIKAPYGKFATKTGSFSKTLSRYTWLTMEIVSPLAFFSTFYIIITQDNNIKSLSSLQYLCLALWAIHYFNRSIIYTFRVPSISPIHLITWSWAIFFNIINAYTNGYWLAKHGGSNNDIDLINGELRVWIGISVWAFGFLSNIYHDNILFSLRKTTKPGEYAIPFGGLYSFISCPNYFSEAIEWTGFAIICWSAPSLCFALSTITNLFPRGYSSHQWYKKKFDNYPTNRKAVIPFLL
ncbi:unnamed protein product [Cunninghamella blakesleeana]